MAHLDAVAQLHRDRPRTGQRRIGQQQIFKRHHLGDVLVLAHAQRKQGPQQRANEHGGGCQTQGRGQTRQTGQRTPQGRPQRIRAQGRQHMQGRRARTHPRWRAALRGRVVRGHDHHPARAAHHQRCVHQSSDLRQRRHQHHQSKQHATAHHQRLQPHPLAQGPKKQPHAHRARAQASHQQTKPFRPQAQTLLTNHRQQRPQGRTRAAEGRRSQQLRQHRG